ncbi:MAG: ActD-like protein [Alphaproteobacteria bacterium]|nr:ActD-like protein [Alphaproteobacteria bacterium]
MTPRRVPDLFVEQLAHGELSPERARQVRAALEAEPGGLDRLAAIAASDAEILEQIPPERFAHRVRARAAATTPARKPAPWRTWAVAATPVLVAAVAALVVIGRPDTGPLPDDSPVVLVDAFPERPKGDIAPEIRVYVQTDAGPQPVVDGEHLDAGAVLQLAYLAAGQRYGVLLSIDGNRTVTLHHPDRRKGTTALVAGGEQRLGRAFELDDAPSFESFLFVTDHAPLDVDHIVEAVKEAGPAATFVGADGQSLPVARFTVRKAKR